MKSVFLQPTVIIASLFILVMVGGGVYAGIQLHSDAADKDALVKKASQLGTGHASAEQIAAELAHAREVAQAESARLNLFVNYPTSPEALAAVREEVYENVLNAIDKIDITVKPAPAQPTAQEKLKEAIAAEKAHIQDVLNQWKELVSNPKANTDPAAAIKATEFANEIKTDINDLKKIVDQLTPDNSGLTPAEIAADKNDVNNAINEVQQAVTDLGQNTVPPEVVQQQQQDANNAQNNVNNLQQDLNNANNPNNNTNQGDGNSNQTAPEPGQTTSPGESSSNPPADQPGEPTYPGTRYVPPPSAQDPDKPHLIEGANSVQ
jgi:hypothetical protein